VLLAQDPVSPPVQTLRFIVQVDPRDLSVLFDQLPDQQASIAKIRLRSSGSPIAYSHEPGFPVLPFVTRQIALPPGAQLVGATAVGLKAQTIGGVPLVAWAQAGRPTRQEPQPPEPIYDDGSFYHYPAPDAIPLNPSVMKSPAWPASLVEIAGTAAAPGVTQLTLAVTPVQWLPGQADLVLHAEVLVEVSWRGGNAPQVPSDYSTAMQMADLRERVVNPEAVPPMPVPVEPLAGDIWYLIITDNYRWNEDFTRGAALDGDVVGEFQRLADWKTEKGLKAGVVRISDIVNGVYGDFTTGARDLQETIRNFLKFASRNWHTYWVLLGGDVEVLPAREVAGSAYGPLETYRIDIGDKPRPDPNHAYWDEATGIVRMRSSIIDPETAIWSPLTGRSFKMGLVLPGFSGWSYATSDAYRTDVLSVGPTEFIVLRGPTEDVANTMLFASVPLNSIPTDAYYASLTAPFYDRPDTHDWDTNDNGLYAQTFGSLAFDQVNFFPNVAVGRAPVKSFADAATFVNKTLAYELGTGPAGVGRRLLLTSSIFDLSGPNVGATASCNESGAVSLCYDRATGDRLLRFAGAPGEDLVWQLQAVESGTSSTVLHYDPDALTRRTLASWFYCADASCTTASETSPAPGVRAPLPTRHVRLVNPLPLPSVGYYFERDSADPSTLEKDAVKNLLEWVAPALDARQRLYQDYRHAEADPAAPVSPLTETAMRTALAEGFGVATFSGHGSESGCCSMSTSMASALTNAWRGVVYADSCLTNAFDTDNAVGEAFLRNPRGGATAYVGYTRYGWLNNGADYEQIFWGRLLTTRHLGTLANSRFTLNRDDNNKWSVFAINLLGDPETPMWVGDPLILTAEHPASALRDSVFAVGVTTPDGSPLPGARVTLTREGVGLASVITPADGVVRFQAEGDEGQILRLTVTKTDYRPYRGDVRIDVSRHAAIPLVAGDNLISTPIQPIATSIDDALAGIAKLIQSVSTWDNLRKRTLVWTPGELNSTLSRFEAGRGYFVRMRAAAVLDIDGIPVVAPIALQPGANMVGFSSLVRLPVSDALKSIGGAYAAVYTWDASAGRFVWYYPGLPRLSTIRYLEPGRGYVIMATKPAIWTLPATPPK
jgi:hypothetical protein